MMMSQGYGQELQDCFEYLSEEARELYLPQHAVRVVGRSPSPLEFLRDFVSCNTPCVINNDTTDWPAFQNWSSSYFRDKIGGNIVTVSVTPNGYADAVHEGYFVMPEERKMTMAAFLDILEGKDGESQGVFYIQTQNSNMVTEFSDIIADIAQDIKFATAALGKCPDAVNFWMGDGRAITSMHKDHYENIYTVISGYKDFILIPPTDLPWIPYEVYPAAHYLEQLGEFKILRELDNEVPWIPLDPLKPDLNTYPLYAKAKPIHCRIEAGQSLYLPSLWFHHVRQSHGCIAVNHWYDMDYDIKYNYFKFLEKLTVKKESNCHNTNI